MASGRSNSHNRPVDIRKTPSRRRLHSVCLLLVPTIAVAGLAGCKEEKQAAPSTASGAVQRARDAAQQNIQAASASPAKVKFRGIQVYSQAAPQKFAVCGQVSPFPDDSNIFVPFVSVVTAQPRGDTTEYQFEQRIGTTTSEAGRVYGALVTFCYEEGGPPPSPVRGVAPTPPLPDTIPDALTRGTATKPVPATSGTKPMEATGTVTMRQNGNLRADPHGAPLRVAAQGSSFKVFGQAPGGWFQVGDTAPIGWVHESMLDRR